MINTDRLIYAAAKVLGKKNYNLPISKAHLYSSSLHIPTEHLSNRLVRKKYIFNGFYSWTKYYSPNQPAASLNTQVYWVMNNYVINLFMTAVVHKIFKLYLFLSDYHDFQFLFSAFKEQLHLGSTLYIHQSKNCKQFFNTWTSSRSIYCA